MAKMSLYIPEWSEVESARPCTAAGSRWVFEIIFRLQATGTKHSKHKSSSSVSQRDKGNPLSSKDDKVARAFIEKYWENIVEKWVNFFVYKKRVRCTDIKNKL